MEEMINSTLILEELVSQPYQNCVISAGLVKGHPVDTMFIRFERPLQEPITILMRPDEMAALTYCISGTLWSKLVSEVGE